MLTSTILLTACDITYEDAPKYELRQNYNVQQQSAHQDQPAVNDSKRQETVIVSRIIDGDTIVFIDPETGKEKTGRLLGINAPESTKEQQLYGKEATSFLSDLIEGKEIQIESDPNAELTDKYGRYLIHGFIGGKSIQYLLVAEGLARVAYLFDNYNYVSLLQEAEEAAKQKGLNIHSVPGYLNNNNGFNMDALSGSIKTKIFDLTKQIIKN